MKKDAQIKINRLKQVLAEKDMPQKDLAEKLNKDPQTISRICNNTHQPSLKLLREMAIVLNVDIRDLLISTPVVRED